MTASSMSLTGSCRRQVYWSDSSKLLVASDTIAACRDRQQEIRKFLTSLAKILRSSSGYGLNSMSNPKNRGELTPNLAEVSDARWLTVDEICRMDGTFEGDREFYRDILPALASAK
jgi:hypothetical protein